ncbi:MAG: PaaX family transcriptional regulator C-terminal domain-containing protein [Beijerinckiaceae bacterium]
MSPHPHLTDGPHSARDDSVSAFCPALDGRPLRAGSFIVTLYGDVVEPRGGRLWVGNIIETCAAVGISETLVRTAVSRLVAAGQLAGEREGRRSFYRLTDTARVQFARAADILFEPQPDCGWRLVWLMPDADAAVAGLFEAAGFARLGPSWLLGPDHPLPAAASEWPGACLSMLADAEAKTALPLQAMAAAHWDLATHARSYQDFLDRFAPLEQALSLGANSLGANSLGANISPAQALQLRLILVHSFRNIVLRDPRLPAPALPLEWPGGVARQRFARLYLALSPMADHYAGASLQSQAGLLESQTPATQRRLDLLERGLFKEKRPEKSGI